MNAAASTAAAIFRAKFLIITGIVVVLEIFFLAVQNVMVHIAQAEI